MKETLSTQFTLSVESSAFGAPLNPQIIRWAISVEWVLIHDANDFIGGTLGGWKRGGALYGNIKATGQRL